MHRQILGPQLRTLHGSPLIILPNPHSAGVRKEFYTCEKVFSQRQAVAPHAIFDINIHVKVCLCITIHPP